MKKLNRIRPRPSHLIVYQGHALLIADLKGFIGGGIEGFYYRQTRFLSKLRFTIDGKEPRSVSANAVDSYSAIAYYLAPSPAGAKAGPQPAKPNSQGEIVRHGIEVQIDAFVANGLRLSVHLTNHALTATSVEICWELYADFADRSEAEQGERQQNAPVDRRWEVDDGKGKLSFAYRHPQLPHGTEILFSGPGGLTEQDGRVSFKLPLEPQQSSSFTLTVAPVFCGERVTLRRGGDVFGIRQLTLRTATD
jgi:hypothetical protein